ncbi:hypothetical protein BS78_03G404600 [Paspalum vaginatum]|nr:hypothetical protein BS78_03G404600 [Paspalum vaginatum]
MAASKGAPANRVDKAVQVQLPIASAPTTSIAMSDPTAPHAGSRQPGQRLGDVRPFGRPETSPLCLPPSPDRHGYDAGTVQVVARGRSDRRRALAPASYARHLDRRPASASRSKLARLDDGWSSRERGDRSGCQLVVVPSLDRFPMMTY